MLLILAPCSFLPACAVEAPEPLRTWYIDADGDGFGDAATAVSAADRPGGLVADGHDCDDADATISPFAEERCDGVDNDCDGRVDQADDDLVEDRCAPTGTTRASDLTAIPGPADHTGFGALVLVSDLDADGRVDLVSAAVTPTEATTYVGAPAWATWTFADPAPVTALAAGDLDGDGALDLVIGVREPAAPVWERGVVHVAFGPLAAGASTTTSTQIAGDGDFIGDIVDVLPGTDGPDALVVDMLSSSAPSDVWLFSPPPRGVTDIYAATTTIEVDSGYFGGAVTALGDLDGDGFAELAVGNSRDEGNVGSVSVFFGPLPTGAVDGDLADRVILGAQDNEGLFGAAHAGDTDGDGLAELIVLSAGDSEGGDGAGAASWFRTLPSTPLTSADADTRLLGEHPLDALSTHTRAADVDADGLDDVLLGAPDCDEPGSGTADVDFGKAWLVYGPLPTGSTPLDDADAAFLGATASGRFGAALALADLDTDGAADLLFGAATAPDADGLPTGAVFTAAGDPW